MKLTLKEASTRLGLTPRQVRYMIAEKTLRAEKSEGRWLIDEEHLPLSERQRRQREEKVQDLRAAVEEALEPHVRKGRRYSVSDIQAFRRGLSCWRAAKELLGAEHPAVRALEACNLAISRGCHSFQDRLKSGEYELARQRAAEAVGYLWMVEGGQVVAEKVEEEILPALSGLIRRSDRRAPR